MVDLSNLLRADPWFCIPHQASDDYVQRLATLLHARLGPTGGSPTHAATAACAARTSTLTCSVSSALISLKAGVVFTE